MRGKRIPGVGRSLVNYVLGRHGKPAGYDGAADETRMMSKAELESGDLHGGSVDLSPSDMEGEGTPLLPSKTLKESGLWDVTPPKDTFAAPEEAARQVPKPPFTVSLPPGAGNPAHGYDKTIPLAKEPEPLTQGSAPLPVSYAPPDLCYRRRWHVGRRPSLFLPEDLKLYGILSGGESAEIPEGRLNELEALLPEQVGVMPPRAGTADVKPAQFIPGGEEVLYRFVLDRAKVALSAKNRISCNGIDTEKNKDLMQERLEELGTRLPGSVSSSPPEPASSLAHLDNLTDRFEEEHAFRDSLPRWRRRWSRRAKEYAALAATLATAAYLAVTPFCPARRDEGPIAGSRVAVQPFRLGARSQGGGISHAGVAVPRPEQSPLEHVVEDTYRVSIAGARTITISTNGRAERYEPARDGLVALSGSLLDEARSHPDARATVTVQGAAGTRAYTLPLSTLVGKMAADYAATRREGSVSRELRSDVPTNFTEWSPYQFKEGSQADDQSPVPAWGRIARAEGLDGAVQAALALYQQRSPGSEHGYMSLSSILDEVNATYTSALTREELVRHLTPETAVRKREWLDLMREKRRDYVARGLAAGMIVREIAEDSGWSRSTIYEDMRKLRAGPAQTIAA